MNINYIKLTLNNLANFKRINHFSNYFNEKELTNVIEQGNNLISQIFIFNKTWDMERCNTPYHLKNLDWDTICNDDEEWCFMLNRMDYLSYLIISYLATNEIKYIEKTKYFINDWIDKHNIINKAPSTRTLDTAIRIMNWINACIVLEHTDNISNDELLKICNSIFKQIKFLKNNYLTKYKTSNWGSIQTTVIVSILPILIQDYKKNNLYKWAYNELMLQLSIQVYPDGMFWEQSTMYHVEVLNYSMTAMFYHLFFNKNKKEKWMKNVEALADSLFYQLTPNFEIEAFGDSDRVVCKDVFHRASVLFEKSEYKYAGDINYDIESLYMFGCNFADKYKSINTKTPKKLTYDGVDSGMYIIRSSFDKNASFTMFTNGSLGSGHGHSDKLHISIIHKGEFILIDAGRFTYREDHPLRIELKSCLGHNGITLNNSPYCKPKDSWGYDNFGIPLKTYSRHIKDFHYLEGSIIGNTPLQVWTRKVIIINPNIWMIVDEIKADKDNFATLRYHIDPYKKIIKKHNNIHIYGKNSNLKLVQDSIPKLEVKKCSLKYNELLDHTVVSYEESFQNEIEFITCICDESINVENVPLYQSDNKTNVQVGQGRKFKISDTESYTIAIYHKEIYKGQKVLYCEDIAFHGKCIIIHEKNGKKSYKLMKT